MSLPILLAVAAFALSAIACAQEPVELPPVATGLATEPLCGQALQVSGAMPSCGDGDLTFSVAVSPNGDVQWAEAIQPSDAATQACVSDALASAVFIAAARCDGRTVA